MKSHTPEIGNTSVAPGSPGMTIVGPIAANVAFVMELTLVPLLLPAIQSQLGLSVGGLSWVFNAYAIAVAIGVLFAGWCGDAFNTRKVFGFGVALFAAGSLLVAGAEDFETVIAGRAIQGFGGGIFSPLVPILLTRASPHKPGRMLIVWGSVAGYVAALAPLFYGSLLGQYSWNFAFALNAAIALIALVFILGLPVADTLRQSSRAGKNYSELFKSRDLWVTFLYVFCTYGSITYFLFRLPVLLSSNEVKTASVGFILSIIWLTFSGFSTLLRNMVDSPNIRMVMLAAPLLISAALPLLFFDDNLVLLVLSSCLIGAGLACSNAPSTQLILRFAPNGMSAASTSLDITFARLGGIVTVAILAETSLAYAATATGVLCLIGALCALRVRKRLT